VKKTNLSTVLKARTTTFFQPSSKVVVFSGYFLQSCNKPCVAVINMSACTAVVGTEQVQPECTTRDRRRGANSDVGRHRRIGER